MIFKILAVAAVLFLVYIVFFKKNRENDIKNNDQEKLEDTFIACPKCGTYVSKDDAILSNGRYFCSEDCLKG